MSCSENCSRFPNCDRPINFEPEPPTQNGSRTYKVSCCAGQVGGCRPRSNFFDESVALEKLDVETGRSFGAAPRHNSAYFDEYGIPIGGGGRDRPRTFWENS